MGNMTNRYVVNAVGKGGQIYLTHCQDKHTLKKWVAEHKHELVMNELRIIDKKRHPLLKLFSFNK